MKVDQLPDDPRLAPKTKQLFSRGWLTDPVGYPFVGAPIREMSRAEVLRVRTWCWALNEKSG